MRDRNHRFKAAKANKVAHVLGMQAGQQAWQVCLVTLESVRRPKSAQIPFMMPPSEENDIKAPQGILKVQVGQAASYRDGQGPCQFVRTVCTSHGQFCTEI